MNSISPRASVHPSALIGQNVVIGPNVTVGAGCVIQSGAVIGEPGFGYQRDHTGRWAEKPHEFGVVIEDDVVIGANTCIDRGSWRDTTIRKGARVDNLAHIAHNAVIGERAVIVAGAKLGGSVTIGAGAWVGIGALVHQRVTVGERSLIGMGAVVLKDVPADQTWAGSPARCLNAEMGVREGM